MWHCINCRGDNADRSKTCPKFLGEQAILRYNYKAENGGTFQQARKAVVIEIHKTISTRTHASAVKSHPRTKPAAPPKDGSRRLWKLRRPYPQSGRIPPSPVP
ncbi:hypothetical protein PoB_005155000 [Plakobranchus ocellatus]|uniref:Uncharacterized protein n=1 Tax=Plakobranchus ocellatus TaxID=259542 RepID=A0AAV4BXA3_9GAST|nr:hypothetical protein PoB_005155000 [Plakobranchus ocellatus]